MSSICVVHEIDGVHIWSVVGSIYVAPFEICKASPETTQKVFEWACRNVRFCQLIDELYQYLEMGELDDADLQLLTDHLPGTPWAWALPRVKQLQEEKEREAQAARQRAVKRELIAKRRSQFASQHEALCLRLLTVKPYECATCGGQDDLTIDHIVPLSKGGTDDLGNLQFLCRKHNSQKGDRLTAGAPA